MTAQPDYLEKPLPSSPESEKVILGAILLDNAQIGAAAERILPEDFYTPFHRNVYRAMLNLFERGEKLEPVLIGEELKREGQLEAMGGVSSITNLTYGLPQFSKIDEYLKVVEDKSTVRNLIRAHSEAISYALAEEDSVENVVNFSEQVIFDVCNQPSESKPELAGPLAFASIQEKWDIKSGKIKLPGLATGFSDIDRILGGLLPGDLIIVAARPSMGKTALCLNIGQNAAISEKAVVAVFSLEMSKAQLIERMIASTAKVDASRYREGFLTEKEWERVDEAANAINGAKLIIDDTPGISPMQMLAKARRIYAQHKKLDLIIVDYLQLMTGSKRSESRQQEVSQISRELKGIAKLLNVPLIALSQLSRACESRNPPKPMMSDLRESGSIEQDADVVAFIYRDEYYKPSEENAGLAELMVAKQRNGPTGTVKLAFQKEFTRFENAYFGESYSAPVRNWAEPKKSKLDEELEDDPRFK